MEDPELATHKAFARGQVHPLILCAPFAHRSYYKPMGYAGDYETVNMMIRDPYEGGNTYAKVLNAFFVNSPTAQAHRYRLNRLTELLAQEAARVAGEGRTCRVLNVGCGPAIEVQRFLQQGTCADHLDLELLDFSQETLEYARSRITGIVQERGLRTSTRFTHQSVHELLKQLARRGIRKEPAYDYVYCAGLFDYLNDRVCSRLLDLFYSWTLPGGLVLATNVHPRHPIRFMLEHLAEWYLMLRSEQDMLRLAPNLGCQTASAEKTGVNVFLEIRKTAAEDAAACSSV